jgi:hypothetical protein
LLLLLQGPWKVLWFQSSRIMALIRDFPYTLH